MKYRILAASSRGAMPRTRLAGKVNNRSGVRVAVYPYGGMQHQEIELDG